MFTICDHILQIKQLDPNIKFILVGSNLKLQMLNVCMRWSIYIDSLKKHVDTISISYLDEMVDLL